MKKKQIITLIIEAVLVVGFVITTVSYSNSKVKPVNVWQFKNEIPVNTEITGDDLVSVTMPESGMNSTFIIDENEIIGKYTTTKVSPQQYVTNDFVCEKDEVDPFKDMDLSEYRKITLPVSYIEAFAGNIKRGDTVDLVYVGKGQKENEEFTYGKDSIQNILVYSVNTDDGFKFTDHSSYTSNEMNAETGDQAGEKINAQANSDKIASVTLAVTADQYVEIVTRQSTGVIKIAGRFEDSKDVNTMGYVIGDYEKIFTGNANAETSSTLN